MEEHGAVAREHRRHRCRHLHAPQHLGCTGHVAAFNDPLIDNRDSKKRYRADVLIEDQMAKYDEKIQKEVDKARKRFGDAFDEEKFRDRKSTRLNSSHIATSRMPSSA